MSRRTLHNVIGGLLILGGSTLAFLALYITGITWPVFLTICVLMMGGGHLISHSWVREIVESAVDIIKAWRS